MHSSHACLNQVFPENAPTKPTWSADSLQFRFAEYEKRMQGVSEREQTKSFLLQTTLMTGVPLCIADLAKYGGPTERDLEYCERVGNRLASQADRLQFREPKGEWCGEGKDRYFAWPTRDLMAQLIEATAIMAFFPGGITMMGLHFEATVPRVLQRNPARFRRQSRGRRR